MQAEAWLSFVNLQQVIETSPARFAELQDRLTRLVAARVTHDDRGVREATRWFDEARERFETALGAFTLDPSSYGPMDRLIVLADLESWGAAAVQALPTEALKDALKPHQLTDLTRQIEATVPPGDLRLMESARAAARPVRSRAAAAPAAVAARRTVTSPVPGRDSARGAR